MDYEKRHKEALEKAIVYMKKGDERIRKKFIDLIYIINIITI